jgi:hypothetical protein
LTFGIGGSESTISCRRQFKVSDLSSSVCRSLVKRLYVIDVDMDHRGWDASSVRALAKPSPAVTRALFRPNGTDASLRQCSGIHLGLSPSNAARAPSG